MNKADGYVKVDRAVMNEEWFKNPKAAQLYLLLVCAANHKDGTFNGLEIKRGQLITSIKHLSEASGQTVDSIRANLKLLKVYNMIYPKAKNGAFTSITIANYGSKIHPNTKVCTKIHTNNIKSNINNSSQGESKDSPEKKKRVRPVF